MQLSGSFKHYRLSLQKAKAPAIPYLGVHLQDLIFIEDGNPDRLGSLINWRKRKLVSNIINTVLYFALINSSYQLDPPSHREALAFLASLPQFPDKELFTLSLQGEPRNAQRGELK